MVAISIAESKTDLSQKHSGTFRESGYCEYRMLSHVLADHRSILMAFSNSDPTSCFIIVAAEEIPLPSSSSPDLEVQITMQSFTRLQR